MSENHNLPVGHRAHLPSDERLTFVPPEDEIQADDAGLRVLKRYVHAVWRRKWLVLLIVAAGTTAGVLVGPHMPVNYMASVTLLFQGGDSNAQMRGPIQASEMLSNDAWISLLRTGTVLDHVAREQRLFLQHRPRDRDVMSTFQPDARYTPGRFELKVDRTGRTVTLTREGTEVETVSVGTPVGRQLGFQWTPPARSLTAEREVRFTVLTLPEGALLLNERLVPRLARGGDFLTLEYHDTDRQRAADVVNAVAERYVDVAADLKTARVRQLRDILQSQLAQAELQLADAQRALEGYRVATITQPRETSSPLAAGLEVTRNPVLSSYFDLTIEREQIERDISAIQRALSSRADSVSVDALSVVGSVSQSPELSQALSELAVLRAELRSISQIYTPAHAESRRVSAAIDTLQRSVVPALAGRLMEDMVVRMRVLDDLAASTSTELRQIPTRAIEEARFRRDVAIAENIANDLRQRFEAARLGSESMVPDVRILDVAMPPQLPERDPRIRIALLAFAASLALATLLAVVLDHFDPRLRYADQVTRDLRLSIIGAVPTLNAGRWPGRNDGAEVIEALRGIRLNIGYAYGSAGPMIFTITSPGSGDGKTFITSNLAIAFSDLGLRVLTIDGDTRRGQLHHLLQLQRSPGLTDYLSGKADLEDVIRTTRYPGVDLLPGGQRLAHAPELLSSPRMGEMLAAIKPEYDVILIDSPPLGAGVDPLVLGTLSGNMLLVMRPGMTDRAVAEAKLQMLDRLPVRILGTVLNGFSGGDAYRYYSYLPGYEASEEDTTPPELAPAS